MITFHFSDSEWIQDLEDGDGAGVVAGPAFALLARLVGVRVVVFQGPLKDLQLGNGRDVPLDPVAVEVGLHLL